MSNRADSRDHLRELIQAVFRATEDLSRLTGRPFSPDGHLVGSLGEVLVAMELELELATPSTRGYDALDKDGRRVEIKTTTRNGVSLSASGTLAERLVVAKVQESGELTIVYDGPSAPAWLAAGKGQKNGQRQIRLSTLRALGDQS